VASVGEPATARKLSVQLCSLATWRHCPPLPSVLMQWPILFGLKAGHEQYLQLPFPGWACAKDADTTPVMAAAARPVAAFRIASLRVMSSIAIPPESMAAVVFGLRRATNQPQAAETSSQVAQVSNLAQLLLWIDHLLATCSRAGSVNWTSAILPARIVTSWLKETSLPSRTTSARSV
jgi:hypothetical protein